MSFLVEDDALETLQVALAFIDTCDSSSSATTPSHSLESLLSTPSSYRITIGEDDGKTELLETAPPGVGASQSAHNTRERNAKQLHTAKTPQSHLDAVKRNREKKKAETVLLREQVAQLEAKLKQLKLTRGSSSSLQVRLQRIRKRGDAQGDDWLHAGAQNSEDAIQEDEELLVAMVQPRKTTGSFWQEMAAMQAHERQKSQALNAELKDAVCQQMKLVHSLDALLLNKKISQFGLDLLRDDQKQYLYNHSVVNQETAILIDLRHRVGQLYLEFGAFFAHPSWTEIADSVVFSSQLKLTPGSGPVVEMRMNAPLRCSFREAGDTVWRRALETKELVQTSHYYVKREQLTQFSYQKVCTILLEGPDGSAMELNGTTYVQRFIGADHDAYVWASAVRLSPEGDVFHEKGWTVASSSRTSTRGSSNDRSNSYKTVSRGFCQIFCDSRDEVEVSTSLEAKDRRAFILKILGNRTRAYHEFTQNLLLNEFSGFQMRQPLLLLSGSESC